MRFKVDENLPDDIAMRQKRCTKKDYAGKTMELSQCDVNKRGGFS
jgi:hypothetical protein